MRKIIYSVTALIAAASLFFTACGGQSAEKPDSGPFSEIKSEGTADADSGSEKKDPQEITGGENTETPGTEAFPDQPVQFHDIILPLDTGFEEEGTESGRIIYYKKDFGRLTGYYKLNEARSSNNVQKMIEEALDTDSVRHEVLTNEQLGTILFTSVKGITGEPDRNFCSAVLNAGIDAYSIQFTADQVMNDRQTEIEAWFRGMIEEITLTGSAAKSITPVPEVEYDFSVTPTPEPREVLTGILEDLNKADEDEFEDLYAASMETISANGLTESWELICRSISGYADYLERTDIKNTVENYWFTNYQPHIEMPDQMPDSLVREIVENGINPLLKDKIYTEGCELSLPEAVWMGTDLEKYGYPETAPERQEGEPIRVLAVDCSDLVAVNHVGLESMSSKYRAEIVERFQKVWNQVFDGKKDLVTIVTDPAQADVIFELTLSYPVAGRYGLTGNVVVHNCSVNVRVWQPGTENEVSADYVTEAGNTVSAPAGSTEVWMHLPDDIDNGIGTAVAGWFGK